MKTIAVIGAGTMGNGIAHTFAQSGFTVKLIDVSEKSLDKGMATIAANLDRMLSKGTITQEDVAKTITNIITYTDIINHRSTRINSNTLSNITKTCNACWRGNS